jgi:hypothetical protein
MSARESPKLQRNGVPHRQRERKQDGFAFAFASNAESPPISDTISVAESPPDSGSCTCTSSGSCTGPGTAAYSGSGAASCSGADSLGFGTFDRSTV